MKRSVKTFFTGMSFNLTAMSAIVLFALCIVASTISYYKFTESLTYQYNDAALRTANTGLALINADDIDAYLAAEGEDPAYQLALQRLQILANKQNVSVVYVIRPDTSDWATYISVFNAPSETSGYTPWVINSVHDTSSEEYAVIYRKMYEEGLRQANVVRDHGLSGAAPHITVLVPVTRSDGTVAGIMCVQRFMDQLSTARKDYTFLVFSVTLGLTVLLMVLFFVVSHTQFVRPLHKIIGETRRFAETGDMDGSLDGKKVSHMYEIKQLATEVGIMEKEIVSYTESLTEATAARERIGTELKVATAIQEGTLPHNFEFADHPEFELYATMNPAKEVGGDFYDFFLLDDDHLALVMADVSGKGVPAALFMMISDILIKERALMGGSPAEVLAHVNHRMCLNNNAEMFVTAWLGILELSTGKLIAANAGHDDPAFMPKGGDFAIRKNKHGVVLGGIDTAKFRDFEIQLEPGDKLFLYTDGLPEATRADNQMLRVEGMLESLNRHKEAKPKEILDGVWQDVQEFVGDAPQFDDLTMLCVQYNGRPQEEPQEDTLVIDANDQRLDEVIAFVSEHLPFDPKTLKRLAIAVEEVFVNVAHYAYTCEGSVKISVYKTDKGFAIRFADKGKPFNPLQKPDPDLTLDADERQIGGLGIYMTKKLCDNVTYEYVDGENRLTMEKYYG